MLMRIFVGNLAHEINEDMIADLFSQYGPVYVVNLISDRDIGKNRGYGFVEMERERGEIAIAAINSFELLGHTLVVAEAVPQREEEFPDPSSFEQELIAFAFFNNRIRLVLLNRDGGYKFLDAEQNLHSILYIASSETLALQQAVQELESLVNDPKSKEQDFQEFFERNPDFILNDQYKKAHPHIILTSEDGQVLIPDFVLEPIDCSSLCDMLELKLPSAPVFVLKKNRERFSAAVIEARAQLLEYRRFFDEKRHQGTIYEKYGLRAWLPKMFLIIGRLGTVNPYTKRKIESAEPDLHLLTYDDILNRVKSRIERMKRGGIRTDIHERDVSSRGHG